MPTYVYACDSCNLQFEQFQSFKDEPLTTCPRCASSIRRVFQPVGIVFKGSGWYITDSRKSESATNAPAAESKKADASAENGTKAESSETSTSTTTNDAKDSKDKKDTDSKPSTESTPAPAASAST